MWDRIVLKFVYLVRFRCGFHIMDRIVHRSHVLHIHIRDCDSEFVLECHYELHDVETIAPRSCRKLASGVTLSA